MNVADFTDQIEDDTFLLSSGFASDESDNISFKELCYDKPHLIALIKNENITDLALRAPNRGSYLRDELPVTAPHSYY